MTAVYTSTPPPDWQGYADQVNDAYNRAVTRLGSQTNNLLTTTGFQTGSYDANTGQFHPTTNADGSLALDTRNPYGSIQTLLNNAGTAMVGAQENAASRNIGDSGLAQQAQNQIRFQSGAQQAGLYNQFQNQFSNLNSGFSDAFSQKNADISSILNQRAAYESQYTNDPTAPGGPQYQPPWLTQLLGLLSGNTGANGTTAADMPNPAAPSLPQVNIDQSAPLYSNGNFNPYNTPLGQRLAYMKALRFQ